ncbi:MAG: GNAT family N-acetyltransferase [Pseudomonadota bacterium]
MKHAKIRLARRDDAGALHHAIDSVAREERWLGRSRMGSLHEFQSFLERLIVGDQPCVVAFDPAAPDAIVGWCDIARLGADSRAHCGQLGMGLLPEWRGRGLGRRLVDEALALADALPFERVELDVVADNTAAIALYQRVGFLREGCKIAAWRLGGVTQDLIVMGRRNPTLLDLGR